MGAEKRSTTEVGTPGGRGTATGSRARVIAFAGALAVLVAVALLVGAIGGWVGRPLSTSVPEPTRTQPPPSRSGSLPPRPSTTAPQERADTIAAWVWLLLALVVAIIVYLLLRRAWDARRRINESRRLAAEPDPTTGPQFEEEPPPAPPAPPGRQFDARAAADAIVSCWVWVEDWAAARGRPRLSFETPTEFLERVIDRPAEPTTGATDGTSGGAAAVPVDAGAGAAPDDPAAAGPAGSGSTEAGRVSRADQRAAAARILLPLYQRARFDVEALDPESAVRARDAALTVCGRDGVDAS